VPGGNWFAKHFTNFDFKTLEQREAFIKEAINLATQQEAALPGVRPGYGLTQLMQHATPNLNMQQGTVKELTNWMLVGHQITKDYADGLNTAVTNYQTGRDKWSGEYNPVKREFDKTWTASDSIHAPVVYEAAANLLNGRLKGDWNKGLSAD